MEYLENHSDSLQDRNEIDVFEISQPIFTITRENLPSYNDVLVDDLPSYEETITNFYQQK